MPSSGDEKVLLVGGGVGTAPLLFMGKEMVKLGCRPAFLLGGRSAGDLMQLDMFRVLGDVYITTEDASEGEKGFVTQHSVWQREHFDRIATCGPKPMMMAVARYAKVKRHTVRSFVGEYDGLWSGCLSVLRGEYYGRAFVCV